MIGNVVTCEKCKQAAVEGGGRWERADCPHGPPREPLLVERQKTHGSFEDNARISQALKLLFVNEGFGDLCDVHREALDMIALKLSRILSGQADFKDHWRDIAGYAKLGEEKAKQ
jgi:hypothetical protein